MAEASKILRSTVVRFLGQPMKFAVSDHEGISDRILAEFAKRLEDLQSKNPQASAFQLAVLAGLEVQTESARRELEFANLVATYRSEFEEFKHSLKHRQASPLRTAGAVTASGKRIRGQRG